MRMAPRLAVLCSVLEIVELVGDEGCIRHLVVFLVAELTLTASSEFCYRGEDLEISH